MPPEESLGVLGLWFPGVATSEWLHYVYNALVLGGLLLIRGRFHGRASLWWNVAICIQLWHHIEHAILLGQSASGNNLFGARAPSSVLQLIVPRVELHLAYNALVTVPIALALWQGNGAGFIFQNERR